MDSSALQGLLPCPYCWKRFKSKKLLNQHLRGAKHKAQPKIRKTNLRCPDGTCHFTCYRHVDLRMHAALEHSCVIEEVTMHFPTLPEFLLWKVQEEKSTGSVFMKHTSGKKVQKDVIKEYYRCHHSNSHSPSAQRKMMKKKEISKLRVVSCPATIEVHKFSDGSVQLTYFKNHFGHEVQDVEQPVLSAEERKLIARKYRLLCMKNKFFFCPRFWHSG